MNRKRINIAGLDEDTVGKLRIQEPDAEFYVEHKAAAGTTGSNLREMPKPPAQAEELAPCTATPGCIGKVGHEGDCMTTLAPSPADLSKTMEAAAAKLPSEARCEKWDGKGHQCVLSVDHVGEIDHQFAQSSPGDAGLPETLQE